ncbi:hypothetical protein GCM10010353_51350 [Streptomyces chryseus]|nr:hypothetical protein GCM10010353_51350 [Streptomyces chryseus]
MAHSSSSADTVPAARSQSKFPIRTGGVVTDGSWTQTGSPSHSTAFPAALSPASSAASRSPACRMRRRSVSSTGEPLVAARSTTSTPNFSGPSVTGTYREPKGNGSPAISCGNRRMASSAWARWTGRPDRYASATGKGRFTCMRHQGRNSAPGSPPRTARRSSPGVRERR